MFSRPPSSDSDNPPRHRARPRTGDPRSPRTGRRVFYTFNPLAQPLAASIERLESAPLASQGQIDALHEAHQTLIHALRGGHSRRDVSASRRSFTDARNALQSASPDGGGEFVSWLDDASSASERSLPVISRSGSSRSSAVVSVESAGGGGGESVYNASVISEGEMERMRGRERALAVRDWEMLREVPVPVGHAQLIWVMRLDEYDDEMVLQGTRGVSLSFARRDV